MLKPESNDKLPRMSADSRARYDRAVAEEAVAKQGNISDAKEIAKRLKEERKSIAELIARLRQARESAGVSLNELEARTGISKSSLSRLENSAAPNPTLLTLHRYAVAVGVVLHHRIEAS